MSIFSESFNTRPSSELPPQLSISEILRLSSASRAKNFRKYCPENVYISMIVAYPTKWTTMLPPLPNVTLDASGVQQVVINVGDSNFGEIFPKEHVEFIDRLKIVGKRSAEDDNGDGDGRSK
ncbi:hypothetical protein CPB97_007977 [Podila verticillata]|nr:hypothetical protein CPB97_007977 [Podila verticillata]